MGSQSHFVRKGADGQLVSAKVFSRTNQSPSVLCCCYSYRMQLRILLLLAAVLTPVFLLEIEDEHDLSVTDEEDVMKDMMLMDDQVMDEEDSEDEEEFDEQELDEMDEMDEMDDAEREGKGKGKEGEGEGKG